MPSISINLKEGTLAKNTQQDLIVGIDLGTTNSLVAYMDENTGQAIAIKDEEGSNKLVPSIIHFLANGAVEVGNNAKGQLVNNPQNTIYSVKRLMGKSFTDIATHSQYFSYKIIDDDTESLVKIRVGDKFHTPIELSAEILKSLKQRAEKALDRSISKAVITVPAYFNDSQRQATRDAGKLAGLEVLRIVNEPTAASLAYGLGTNQSQAQTIAVYDLGGGTFDISILQIEEGIFEVLATNGNTFLGGDDFDRAIVDYWLEQANLTAKDLQANKALGQNFRLAAEAAKMALGTQGIFETTINKEPFSLSKEQFNALAKPLVEQTLKNCQQALKDANLNKTDINEIVLVGGSTRMPLVQEMVAAFFEKPVHTKLNPDEVVALGAAIQADILAGNNKDMLLLDITPLSLGIETMGGLMDVIIPRNSKVPTKAGREYTTQVDGQVNMRIAVYQGERDLIADNRKLGEFELKGIPAMPAGFPKVEIAFIIDADGILRVRAKELRSGIEQSIEVRPSYGISETEMAKMLLASMQNAQTDMQARALQEALNEADQIINTTEKFITKNTEHLSTKEITETQKHIAHLKTTLASKDKDKIHAAIEQLNDFSRPFAERIMDVAIASAMKGKKI